MTKNEFIETLREALKALPASEIEKSVNYYSEIIEDKIEDGICEEEAVNGLGNVTDIAEEILFEMPLQTLVKEKAKRNSGVSTVMIILLTLAFPLLIALMAVVFSVFVTIWAVLFSLAVTMVALLAGGAVALIITPFKFAGGMAFGIYSLAGSLCVIGIGLMLINPVIYLTTKGVKFSKYLADQIVKLIKKPFV